jgi:hypothetical protein
MSVSALRARLSALRKNIPSWPTESLAREYNSMVDEFESELQDKEFAHFKIPESDIKPRIVSVVPGRGANYSTAKYCEDGVLKRQVDGLWAYLEAVQVVEREEPKSSGAGRSHVINFNAPVSGSTFQQGDHNTVVNYQNDLRAVLDEIRSVINAAKLSPDVKQELTSDVETVEVQMKSPKPKFNIIRESLGSARHILEHAVGAGMAHAYFPLLLAFLERHH